MTSDRIEACDEEAWTDVKRLREVAVEALEEWHGSVWVGEHPELVLQFMQLCEQRTHTLMLEKMLEELLKERR
jgi:hypothetical protein